jgi:hypothetical protein
MKKHVCTFLLVALSLCLWGCQGSQRQDTVISSVSNPSNTYRATILLREYFVDGHLDNSPTTYVLLDRDSGKPTYEAGQDFKDSQVVMKPSQCGPLSLDWKDDNTLKITCEKCGIALSAIGEHARGVGSIQVDYEGFPDMSSWETAPRAR